jgi:hypothetical protein
MVISATPAVMDPVLVAALLDDDDFGGRCRPRRGRGVERAEGIVGRLGSGRLDSRWRGDRTSAARRGDRPLLAGALLEAQPGLKVADVT